jgi:uncharacterized protein
VIIRVGDLQPEGMRIDRQLQIGPLGFEGDQEIGVSEARIEVHVTRHGEGLACAGRLFATALVPCSRCLEPFSLGVDRSFDVSYLPPPLPDPSEPELQIFREDLDVSYLGPEGGLEVEQLAAEQIYLEIPLKPLCSEDCKGLCPGCGANLNHESCTCRTA